MNERVKHLVPHLKRIKRSSVKDRRKMIKCCDKELVNCFCECALNLLKGHVPVNKHQLSSLRRHKHSLKKLVLKKTPINQKKKILQKGGFLGALLTPVLAFLSNVFGGNGA